MRTDCSTQFNTEARKLHAVACFCYTLFATNSYSGKGTLFFCVDSARKVSAGEW